MAAVAKEPKDTQSNRRRSFAPDRSFDKEGGRDLEKKRTTTCEDVTVVH